MAEIAFPEGARGNHDWVMFPATVDGNPVTCKILLEVLANRFGAPNPNGPGLLKVFQANRPAIEAMARRLINIHRYESDRSIVIRGTDVQPRCNRRGSLNRGSVMWTWRRRHERRMAHPAV